MSFEPEYILDRRKLKWRLNKWRGIAIGVALLALLGTIIFNKTLATSIGLHDQIARIDVSGIITENKMRAQMLEELRLNKGVRAVIVRFNSPGGTTTGGEALYENLRKIAQDRPVVAVFGTMATSAAYMSGVAADHIVARGNSITGSVGVILQWAEITEAMSKLGVKVNELKSGALKAVPSPFQPLDEDGRRLSQEMIDESHQWFVDLVVKRRGLAPSDIPGFLEGRIFSGRQALKFGLIDAIGGEDQALAWLRETKKIPLHLPVIDWMSGDQVNLGAMGMAKAFFASLLGVQLLPDFLNVTRDGLSSTTKTGGLISKWRDR